MQVVELIERKRDGHALTREQIDWLIDAYMADRIADYQMSAMLMAICWRGMDDEETVALTQALAHSGTMMSLSGVDGYIVDKHSSGGVGDKTSLVVLPLVASYDVPIAKMSGRGLGFTGGTLDKLESIPGFDVMLDDAAFLRLAREQGLVLAGQTGELAPADGRLYALRDVTGTVGSLPLIASSIMSKKLASGADGIVLDVKWGLGAFMASLEEARELAQIMVSIGHNSGHDMVALLSDMNQPLGYAVGNALEVVEAIDTMKGDGPADLVEHCVVVAAYMLQLAGHGERWQDTDQMQSDLRERLRNGQALERFTKMVEAQGGDSSVIHHTERLPQASQQMALEADSGGYVQQVHAMNIARAALALGAGRQRKEDRIDPAVGIVVTAKVGERIEAGQRYATLYGNSGDALAHAAQLVRDGLQVSQEPVDALPLINDVIEASAGSA